MKTGNLKECLPIYRWKTARMRDVIGKKALEPVAKKAVVAQLQTEYYLSERRACQMVNLARSVFRYTAHPPDNSQIQSALAELAARHRLQDI